MTPAEADARLLALPRFADVGAVAYRPGLDRMRALLAALGDPHRGLPAVHVAGTNGKGSTASLIAAIGTASGRRVGLHTSPHLLRIEERMRVDGVPAPADWLADAVGRFAEALDAVEPSFFEATVALSLRYFAEARVDLAVVEVGLGGRLDATNVLDAADVRASVVTHVGLDHTDLLGETLAEIAREKAGIARPRVPLLHAVTDPAARDALTSEAEAQGALVEDVRRSCRAEVRPDGRLDLETPVRRYEALEVGLAGPHQRQNAALAVRTAEVVLGDVSRGAVRNGVRGVVGRAGLRGRSERLPADPRVVLDVAHNADGWRAALAAVEVPPGGWLWALLGVMADKDAEALARLLADAGARALCVDLGTPRARPATRLADALRQRGADAEATADVGEALARFRSGAGPADRLLVTGSHVTVEAVLRAVEVG